MLVVLWYPNIWRGPRRPFVGEPEMICFGGSRVRGPRESHDVEVVGRPETSRASTYNCLLLDERLLVKLQLPRRAAHILRKGLSCAWYLYTQWKCRGRAPGRS